MKTTPNDLTIQSLKKVLAVNGQINSTLEIGALLEIIMKTAAEVMQTQAASLLLIDEKTTDLVFQVALGEKGCELKEKFRVKMGEGIAGSVAKTGESLRVNDVNQDPRFAKRFDASTGFVTKSILCVPMHSRGKIIGVLQAINPVDGRVFSSDDQFLFETFADQAAIAVENARMHTEILKQERAKQELKIAHDIQQNFLPDLQKNSYAVDTAAENIPAREVGGDFYDVIQLDQHRTGIVIGDVSGKGVPAALYMVRAISEYRFLAQRLKNPGELLTALNDILAQNSPFGMFVTLAYMIVDRSSKTLVYSSGGHLPLLKRSASGKVEVLENIGGPPVGLMPETPYAQKEIKLEKGDALLAYTDGVTEARNINKQEYGIENLKTCFQQKTGGAADYTTEILNQIKTFTQGAEAHDDITALAVVIPE